MTRRALLVALVPGWKTYALLYRLDPPLASEEWVLLSPIDTTGWQFKSESVVDAFVPKPGLSFIDAAGKLIALTPDDCALLDDYELWGTADPLAWLTKYGYEPILSGQWPV